MSEPTGTPPPQTWSERWPPGSVVARASGDQPSWIVRPAVLAEVARFLRDDPAQRFDLLLDLAGLDGPRDGARDGPRAEARFAVVIHLASLPRGDRLRLVVPLPEADPSLPSLVPIWPAAEWFEREAAEMFGLCFEGHPDPRRLFTHAAFEGYPLRKDYDPARRWLLNRERATPSPLVAGATADAALDLLTVDLGPSHPALHAAFQLIARLDGETIVEADVETGFLHRCFEKLAESQRWQQVIPLTDRLNYNSPLINNVAYCRAVEHLLAVEVPPRAVWARTLLSELSRVADHALACGTTLVDAGALPDYGPLMRVREEISALLEAVSGARLTVSYGRIGGLASDLPEDFVARCRHLLAVVPGWLDAAAGRLRGQRVWLDRAVGVAAITAAEAVARGWTGPCLRATGVAYDVRRAAPYDLYDELDFELPVYRGGDVFDRTRVRLDECRQSLSIVRQLLDRGLPAGPFVADDHRVAAPARPADHHPMALMIEHSKRIVDGIEVPPGEVYSMVESPNGELAFYAISDGSAAPYRLKVRPPCLPLFATFPRLVLGGTIADALVALGSLNVVAGELER